MSGTFVENLCTPDQPLLCLVIYQNRNEEYLNSIKYLSNLGDFQHKSGNFYLQKNTKAKGFFFRFKNPQNYYIHLLKLYFLLAHV